MHLEYVLVLHICPYIKDLFGYIPCFFVVNWHMIHLDPYLYELGYTKKCTKNVDDFYTVCLFHTSVDFSSTCI